MNIPLPRYADDQLFSSFESLYKSTKSSFLKFIKSIRRTQAVSARGSRRRGAVSSLTTGRNIRIVRFSKESSKLAPVQTIISSVLKGNYDLEKRALAITDDDLLGWRRSEYESLTLILVVDVSKSTRPFIKVFQEILRSMTGYFHQHNDRVGLISLQGLQAQIFNHPTHNFRVVARGLTKLKFHGETPLADGLFKAYNMAKLEKAKNPGSRSIVILLSDCYPEPTTPEYENKLEDPVYRNAVNVAAYYKKRRITLLVINPAFQSEEGNLPGEILSKRIVEASGGKLIKLFRPKDYRELPLSKKEMEMILSDVEKSISQSFRQT